MAVSDSKGGIYNPKGIDPNKRPALQAGARHACRLSGSDPITNEEILEIDCDMLVPAALESVITGRNAAASRPR